MTKDKPLEAKESLATVSVEGLAELYVHLIKLAEQDRANIHACMRILWIVADLTACAHLAFPAGLPPVYDLNEYFLYLLDAQKQMDDTQQEYVRQTLQQFKSRALEWAYETAPQLKDGAI